MRLEPDLHRLRIVRPLADPLRPDDARLYVVPRHIHLRRGANLQRQPDLPGNIHVPWIDDLPEHAHVPRAGHLRGVRHLRSDAHVHVRIHDLLQCLPAHDAGDGDMSVQLYVRKQLHLPWNADLPRRANLRRIPHLHDSPDVQRRLRADLRGRRDLSEHRNVLGRDHVSECPDVPAEQPDLAGVCHMHGNNHMSFVGDLLGHAYLLRFGDMLHHVQHDMRQRDL